jgi:hypothetical protein
MRESMCCIPKGWMLKNLAPTGGEPRVLGHRKLGSDRTSLPLWTLRRSISEACVVVWMRT